MYGLLLKIENLFYKFKYLDGNSGQTLILIFIKFSQKIIFTEILSYVYVKHNKNYSITW